jgi:hypothetical protein
LEALKMAGTFESKLQEPSKAIKQKEDENEKN